MIPCAAFARWTSGWVVRVHLDRVDGRNDRRPVQQLREHIRHEVADADRTHTAVGEQGLQCAVGLDGAVEPRRQRLVKQQQVDLLDAELAGTLVERVQGLVVAVVADPHLGLDEHLGAVHARAANTLTHLTLVEVGGSGVDQPVADPERLLDRCRGDIRRRLEDTESDRRHLDTIVQLEVHVTLPSGQQI
jgi:hypothetical protein